MMLKNLKLRWNGVILSIILLFDQGLHLQHDCFSQTTDSIQVHPQSDLESEEDSNDVDIIVRENLVQSETVKIKHSNLEDFLHEQGVATLSTGGEASRLELQLRGGSGAQAGIYIDQIPLHGLRARAIDLNLFALDLFQEVQIQHGGQGAQGGSGVMSGSIRFIPKSMTKSMSSNQIKLHASTQGYGQISGLTHGLLHPKHVALLAISLGAGPNRYAYTDQYGFNRRRAYSDFRRLAGLGQIESRWYSWHFVTLLGAGDLNRGEPGPETFSLPQRRSQQYARFLSISAYSPNVQINNGLLYAVIHGSLLSSFYGFNEAYPLWQSQSNANNEFYDQRHLFKFSLNYEYERWISTLNFEFSNTQAQVLSLQAQRFQSAIVPSLKYLLSKHFSLNTASRLDISTERTSEIVPSVNLVYQQAKLNAWRSWISWSRVWRDPGFDERYLVGPSLIPNPQLKPESGQWVEWGNAKSLRYNFRHSRLKLKFSLKLFYQDFDQLIHYVPIDPYRIRAENIEGAKYYGLEQQFDASLFVSDYQITSQTYLNLLKHKLKSPPFTPLPLRPQAMANTRLTIRKRLKLGSIDLWSSVQYRGATSIDLFAERSLAARNIVDFGLNRTWRNKVQTKAAKQSYRLSVKLKNLTNQNQYDFALQPIPGRSLWFALAKLF